MSSAHVAPLAVWMAEHHPDVPFDRTRWAGTLNGTADEVARALETQDPALVPTSAVLNERMRTTRDRAASDRARAECRARWEASKGAA